jgi:hypothetical protein
MDRMERTHWREIEGHKKRGGSVNIRFEGRGGMLMVVQMYSLRRMQSLHMLIEELRLD